MLQNYAFIRKSNDFSEVFVLNFAKSDNLKAFIANLSYLCTINQNIEIMEIKKYDTYRGVFIDDSPFRYDVMVVLTDAKNVEEPSTEDSEKYENFKKLERGEMIGIIIYFPYGTNDASDIKLVDVDNFKEAISVDGCKFIGNSVYDIPYECKDLVMNQPKTLRL